MRRLTFGFAVGMLCYLLATCGMAAAPPAWPPPTSPTSSTPTVTAAGTPGSSGLVPAALSARPAPSTSPPPAKAVLAATPTPGPVFIATARPLATAASSTPRAPPIPQGTAVPGRPPVEITMRDNVFVPEYVEVAAGTRVRWRNAGANDHDVVADGDSFSSDPLRPGQTLAFVLSTPGTYTYVCDLHDNMVGTVVVHL